MIKLSLALFDLIDELLEPVSASTTLIFLDSLAFLVRHPHDQRRQFLAGCLDFLLSVHVVVLIKVDCFGASAQILLRILEVNLLRSSFTFGQVTDNNILGCINGRVVAAKKQVSCGTGSHKTTSNYGSLFCVHILQASLHKIFG